MQRHRTKHSRDVFVQVQPLEGVLRQHWLQGFVLEVAEDGSNDRL